MKVAVVLIYVEGYPVLCEVRRTEESAVTLVESQLDECWGSEDGPPRIVWLEDDDSYLPTGSKIATVPDETDSPQYAICMMEVD